MPELVRTEIEEYAREHSTPESELFREISQYTRENTPLPQMQSGHIEGLFLRMLVQAIGAKKVLEIGTFTGFSALMMAHGLPEDGKLITCDVNEEWTGAAKKFWARDPHGKKIDLRLGPALETVRKLEGPFDLVFIDADKENYIHYWDECMPKVRHGGFVVVDNVLWSGRVLDPRDKMDKAVVAFNDHARNDSRVDLVMLTVRDGITLARKI